MILPFNKEDHNHIIELKWMIRLREMDDAISKDIPEHGLISWKWNGDGPKEWHCPVAMGFLRRMEGNYGILDSYISNPELNSETRNAALDEITAGLISLAKKLYIVKLFAFSSEKNIIDRACRHGFYKVPYDFTVLDLRGE